MPKYTVALEGNRVVIRNESMPYAGYLFYFNLNQLEPLIAALEEAQAALEAQAKWEIPE